MTVAIRNYCKNPSFEVNVTDDWTTALGVSDQSATQHKYGSFSARLTAGGSGVNSQMKTIAGLSVPAGATVTISGQVYPNGAGDFKAGLIVYESTWTYSNGAYNAGGGAWEYLACSVTNGSGVAKTFYMLLQNLYQDGATYAYFDACQLELASAAMSYCDGSLGTGYSWEGAANNSTSIYTNQAWTKAVNGTLTSAGVIARKIKKVMAGVLASVGGLLREWHSGSGGGALFYGELSKTVKKPVAGVWNAIGSLATQLIAGGELFYQAVAGTLVTAGTLARKDLKALAGSLSSSGGLSRLTKKVVAGGLSSAGGLVRKTLKAVSGALTSAGALARALISGPVIFYRAVGGALTFSGGLARKTLKAVAGVLASAGSLSPLKLLFRVFAFIRGVPHPTGSVQGIPDPSATILGIPDPTGETHGIPDPSGTVEGAPDPVGDVPWERL